MKTVFTNNALKPQQGISYIEVLVATVLIALMLVPALEALLPGIEGAALHKQRSKELFVLQGQLETVLAQKFDDLDNAATTAGAYNVATSYSNAASEIPYNVYIWRYDINNEDGDDDVNTGGEGDLLWIKITNESDSGVLQTLISRY